MIWERKISTNSVFQIEPPTTLISSFQLTHTHTHVIQVYILIRCDQNARAHTERKEDICLIWSRNGTEHAILYENHSKQWELLIQFYWDKVSVQHTHSQTHAYTSIRATNQKIRKKITLMFVVGVDGAIKETVCVCVWFWLWFMKESANGRKWIIISPFLDLCLISEIFWFVTRNCWYCYHSLLY